MLTVQPRLMCKSALTQLIAAQTISKIQTPSSLNAGLATRSLRVILKKPLNPSLLGHAVVLAESKSIDLDSSPPIPITANILFSPLPSILPKQCTNNEKKISLAYLEMRLILARMLWSFDMQLSTESEDWDDQESWIQWDKKPLLVKLRLVGKQE